MIKRGVDKDIANWYKDYLTDRHAHIVVKDTKTTRRLTVGCPQGGVLSTILWNLAFDDMLKLFDHHGIKCVGYVPIQLWDTKPFAHTVCFQQIALLQGGRLPLTYVTGLVNSL